MALKTELTTINTKLKADIASMKTNILSKGGKVTADTVSGAVSGIKSISANPLFRKNLVIREDISTGNYMPIMNMAYGNNIIVGNDGIDSWEFYSGSKSFTKVETSGPVVWVYYRNTLIGLGSGKVYTLTKNTGAATHVLTDRGAPTPNPAVVFTDAVVFSGKIYAIDGATANIYVFSGNPTSLAVTIEVASVIPTALFSEGGRLYVMADSVYSTHSADISALSIVPNAQNATSICCGNGLVLIGRSNLPMCMIDSSSGTVYANNVTFVDANTVPVSSDVVVGFVNDKFVAIVNNVVYQSVDTYIWNNIGDVNATITGKKSMVVGDRIYFYTPGDNVSQKHCLSIQAPYSVDVGLDNAYYDRTGALRRGTLDYQSLMGWRENNAVFASTLTGVARGFRQIIGVCQGGHTYVSKNGISWTATQATGKALRDVAFGAGCFVAVGDAGYIGRSIDFGTTWTAASPPATNFNYTGVYFDENFGAFVAVGGTHVSISLDGVLWDDVVIPGGTLSGGGFGVSTKTPDAISFYLVNNVSSTSAMVYEKALVGGPSILTTATTPIVALTCNRDYLAYSTSGSSGFVAIVKLSNKVTFQMTVKSIGVASAMLFVRRHLIIGSGNRTGFLNMEEHVHPSANKAMVVAIPCIQSPTTPIKFCNCDGMTIALSSSFYSTNGRVYEDEELHMSVPLIVKGSTSITSTPLYVRDIGFAPDVVHLSIRGTTAANCKWYTAVLVREKYFNISGNVCKGYVIRNDAGSGSIIENDAKTTMGGITSNGFVIILPAQLVTAGNLIADYVAIGHKVGDPETIL